MALAAPQLFTRPGSGVSNIPTELAAFAAPQFGDIADAVNAATGNVYFDLGILNRNNITKPGDDTVSTTGGLRVNGLSRLSGFNSTMNPATLPQEWSVALGDGSFDLYRRASNAEIDNAPTWINERYAGIRGGVSFYIRKTQTGVQTDEQWVVTFQLPNSRLISHLYDRSGTRTTFYNDGEYPDYTQTLHQQYRTAKYRNDAEGIDLTAPKTEFTYTAPGNGHLSKVKDEWGRVTTYQWNDALNRVDAVNMLVQDEANPGGSWKRRVEYSYEQRGGQYYVTYMVHRTYDATGNPIGRWFDLDYTEQNGQVLLHRLGRPRAADQTDASQPGMVYTTYTYDTSNRVSTVKTPGEADISFTYNVSAPDGAGGQQVIRTQGDKRLTLYYTAEGWLRTQTERDFNTQGGLGAYDRTLNTTYWYDGEGRVLAHNLPGGAQIQNVYDSHGNKVRETVYRSDVAWAPTPPAGYERTTQYEYDRDNQLINTIQEARSGTVAHPFDANQTASYSYGTITRPQPRGYYSASAGAQTLRALAWWNDDLVVDGAWVGAPNHFYDEYGRLTRTQSHGAGTPVVNTDYEYHGGTARNLQPSSDGDVDWNRQRQVMNFGDQVHRVWVYENGKTRAAGRDTQYFYDEFGNVSWTYRANNYAGRWNGNVAEVRTHETFQAFNGFGQQEWQYELTHNNGIDYRNEGRSLTKYFTSGEPKFSFTGNPGNLTNYMYNVQGQLTQLKMGAGANGTVTTPRRTTTYAYDVYGRKASEATAGHVTTFEYDTRDNVAKQVNPDGSVIRKQYNNRAGGLYHEQVSRAGEPPRFTFHDLDSLGREYRTRSNTSVGDKIVDTLYDAFDRPIRNTNHALTMNSSLTDRSTYLRYDTLGRLIKKLDPALITHWSPYADARRPYTEYGYDWRGRQTGVTNLLYGGTVTPASMTMPQGAALAGETTEYDIYDRAVKVTDPAGYATTMTYDHAGNVTALTKQVWKGDEADYAVVSPGFTSATTRMAYNAARKTVQTVDARGNSSYTDYDLNGNVTLSTDARGVVTKAFTYTPDNLLERVWEPDNNAGTTAKYGQVSIGSLTATHKVTEFHQYGLDGSMKPLSTWRAHMDADVGPYSGARTDYKYDHAGRTTETTLPPDESNMTAIITQQYDSLGNVTMLVDANGFPTVNTYNEEGKLSSSHQKSREGNAVDSASNLKNGLLSTYRYDLNGNLIYKNERNMITQYRYNSIGKVIYESRPRVGEATTTNWKFTTYRLDGLPVVKTSYTYQGNLASQPHIALAGDGSLSVTDGNATITEYSARGDIWAEWSLAGKRPDGVSHNRFEESQYWQYVNGAGQRYRRVFLGNSRIYAEQKAGEVSPIGHSNSLTFWRFDEAGKIIEKWDTPMNNSSWMARDGSDKQNWFRYSHSATGKEITQIRDIRIRQKGQSASNSLNTRYGGNDGVYLAASVGTVTTVYNERDQIESVSISDKVPILSSATPPMQNEIGYPAVPNQSYSYYQSGQLKKSSSGVSSLSYEKYDQRGRVTKARDSSGGGKFKFETLITTHYSQSGRVDNRVARASDGLIIHEDIRELTVGGLEGSIWNSDEITEEALSHYYSKPEETTIRSPVLKLYGNKAQDSLSESRYSITYKGKHDPYGKPLMVYYGDTYKYDDYGQKIQEMQKSTYPANGVYACEQAYEDPETCTKVYQINEAYDSFVETYRAQWSDDGYLKTEFFDRTPRNYGRCMICYWEANNSDYSDVRIDYNLDSNGKRTESTGMSKRYNQDNQAAAIIGSLPGTRSAFASSKHLRVNNFRYDTYGNQVVSSTSGIDEVDTAPWLNEHAVFRDWNNSYYSGESIQVVLRRAGLFMYDCTNNGNTCSDGQSANLYRYEWLNGNSYRSNDYLIKDSTYSLADGWHDTTKWNGTAPFALLKNINVYESPIKPLSSILKLDPLNVNNGRLPNLIDPGKVKIGVAENNKPVDLKSANNSSQLSYDNGGSQKIAPSVSKELHNDLVYVQEVSIGFDDGQGFDTPIYAVRTFSEVNKIIKGWDALLKSLDDYGKSLVKQRELLAEKVQEYANATIKEAGTAQLNLQARVATRSDAGASYQDNIEKLVNFGRKFQDPAEALEFLLGIRLSVAAMTDAYLRKDYAAAYYTSQVRLVSDMADYLTNATREGKSRKSIKDHLFPGADQLGYNARHADELIRRNMETAAGFLDISSLGSINSLNRARPGDTRLSSPTFNSGLRSISCRNSFSPNTLVRTLSGLVAISALSIGTPVLAFNEQTGQNGYYPITDVITHGTKDQGVTYLTLTDPDNKNKLEFIETTPEHPFFVAQPADAQPRPALEGHRDLSRNWVGAGHLKIGDKIKQADGTTGLVANVTTIQQTREMFNLTVSEAHTYYVGQDGWLVHNVGSGGCPALNGDLNNPAAVDASVQAGRTARATQPITYIKGQKVETSPGTTIKIDVDLSPTISNIRSGTPIYRQDGTVYGGSGLAPRQYGYYKEYVVPTPGISGAGSQRIVVGASGEMYYTANHYQSFTKLVPNR